MASKLTIISMGAGAKPGLKIQPFKDEGISVLQFRLTLVHSEQKKSLRVNLEG
jgi:hypothetical protein